jgi:hypothetical protein
MTRVEKVAQQLLKPINTAFIVIFGVYTIVWGFWVFCPFWTVFTQAPLYAVMASISTEYVWGLIAMACGLLISRGAFYPSRRNLQWGMFVGFLHWLTIAILYFMGDWTSTGGITSLTFAVYAALVWVNIKVNPEYYPTHPPTHPHE